LKPCRFFEVIVIDDVYDNDFNDGDLFLGGEFLHENW